MEGPQSPVEASLGVGGEWVVREGLLKKVGVEMNEAQEPAGRSVQGV